MLLDHVNFFLDFLDNPSFTVQVAQTVTEVFYENKAICSQVTENQIRKFLNQMAKRKHRAYLDFFFVRIDFSCTHDTWNPRIIFIIF